MTSTFGAPGRRPDGLDGLDGGERRLEVLRVEGQLSLDLGVRDGQDVARDLVALEVS
jgi:hypothetical protein